MRKKFNQITRQMYNVSLTRKILLLLLFIFILNAVYLAVKPIPAGLNYASEMYYVADSDILFLSDITYDGELNHTIFDTLFTHMQDAEDFIVADMFLLSQNYDPDDALLNNTEEFFGHLQNGPAQTVLITDPINTFYGSHTMPLIEQARESGVDVYLTDLAKLRPSNLAYSMLYYPWVSWVPTAGSGLLAHPFGGEGKVTIRSLFRLANFQANHRKVAVMDSGETHASFILSANPHNPSSLHSNMGFLIYGDFAKELLATEQAVPGVNADIVSFFSPTGSSDSSSQDAIGVQLLTEQQIRAKMVFDIDATTAGDSIEVAIFYFSDRHIVRALKRAANRGVTIDIVLDPNKDAFGREKNGVPNRQVALELQTHSELITVRWYNTTGEQFHAKMLVIRSGDTLIVHGGSANFTRRNIGNYNLETNVRVIAPIETQFSADVLAFLSVARQNSLAYTAYEDKSRLRYWQYRFMEWSGLSTF